MQNKFIPIIAYAILTIATVFMMRVLILADAPLVEKLTTNTPIEGVVKSFTFTENPNTKEYTIFPTVEYSVDGVTYESDAPEFTTQEIPYTENGGPYYMNITYNINNYEEIYDKEDVEKEREYNTKKGQALLLLFLCTTIIVTIFYTLYFIRLNKKTPSTNEKKDDPIIKATEQ